MIHGHVMAHALEKPPAAEATQDVETAQAAERTQAAQAPEVTQVCWVQLQHHPSWSEEYDWMILVTNVHSQRLQGELWCWKALLLHSLGFVAELWGQMQAWLASAEHSVQRLLLWYLPDDYQVLLEPQLLHS